MRYLRKKSLTTWLCLAAYSLLFLLGSALHALPGMHHHTHSHAVASHESCHAAADSHGHSHHDAHRHCHSVELAGKRTGSEPEESRLSRYIGEGDHECAICELLSIPQQSPDFFDTDVVAIHAETTSSLIPICVDSSTLSAFLARGPPLL